MLKYLSLLIGLAGFAGKTFAQQMPKQVPIICYHQIREWKPKDSQRDKEYIIPPATFKAHLKMLADSGYHTILPDELYSYLTKGTALPPKTVMLTFDDSMADQFKVARPELAKYGFKAVFFITIKNIAKNKGYMTQQEVQQLAGDGHIMGCHTLTHANLRKLSPNNWNKEVDVSKQKLEALIGKPVSYFAYPFGMWKKANLPLVKHSGFLAAFQLDEPRDPTDPLMTIRRVIDNGDWDKATFLRHIRHDFGR